MVPRRKAAGCPLFWGLLLCPVPPRAGHAQRQGPLWSRECAWPRGPYFVRPPASPLACAIAVLAGRRWRVHAARASRTNAISTARAARGSCAPIDSVALSAIPRASPLPPFSKRPDSGPRPLVWPAPRRELRASGGAATAALAPCSPCLAAPFPTHTTTHGLCLTWGHRPTCVTGAAAAGRPEWVGPARRRVLVTMCLPAFPVSDEHFLFREFAVPLIHAIAQLAALDTNCEPLEIGSGGGAGLIVVSFFHWFSIRPWQCRASTLLGAATTVESRRPAVCPLLGC